MIASPVLARTSPEWDIPREALSERLTQIEILRSNPTFFWVSSLSQ